MFSKPLEFKPPKSMNQPMDTQSRFTSISHIKKRDKYKPCDQQSNGETSMDESHNASAITCNKEKVSHFTKKTLVSMKT